MFSINNVIKIMVGLKPFSKLEFIPALKGGVSKQSVKHLPRSSERGKCIVAKLGVLTPLILLISTIKLELNNPGARVI